MNEAHNGISSGSKVYPTNTPNSLVFGSWGTHLVNNPYLKNIEQAIKQLNYDGCPCNFPQIFFFKA
jgi:hypothetical protein